MKKRNGKRIINFFSINNTETENSYYTSIKTQEMCIPEPL